MKRKTWIFGALCVAFTLFIFSNSLQTGEESSAASGWVMQLLTPVLAVLEGIFGPADWMLIIRKGAHMTEFAVLAVLVSLFVRFLYQDTGKRILGWGMFYALATAVCDEFIQLFSPGRAGMVSDVLIDFSGALLGFGITRLILLIIDKRKNA